eukprot:gene5525-6210_t
MSNFWGEVEDSENSEDTSKIILASKQGNFRNGFSNFDLPSLHQPTAATQKMSKKELSKQAMSWLKMPCDSFGQNYILHSIELQHYKKRMRYMITAAQSHQIDVMKGGAAETSSLPSAPPPPKRFCSSTGFLRSTHQKSFLSSEFDASNEAVDVLSESQPVECPIELDPVASRQLLMKSVAASCAHAGFEYGSEVALNTLTDVFVDHLSKICKLFALNTKSQSNGKKCFENSFAYLEQTCRDFGLESISSLQEYWSNAVCQVAIKLEQESVELFNEYNAQKESSVDKRKLMKDEKI